VEPDSPAAKVGIQAGDRLTSYRGESLSVQFHEQLPSIYKMIADTPVGEEVEILISRQEDEKQFTVTTEERSEATSDEIECENWGFTAKGITREFALEFNLPDQSGVLVVGVKPNGAAYRARLFPGDRVVAVNEDSFEGLDGLREIYERLDGSKASSVLLTVMRRHSRRLILIETTYE
jgi:serine protease Do